LDSASRRKVDKQDNSFVTPSTSEQNTQNINSRPNFVSNTPMIPNYFIKTQADSAYSLEGRQHYPNNPSELYPQFSHPIYKPNYPHTYVPSDHWGGRTPYGSSEDDRYGYNAEEHYSSHETGMHPNYNPTATGADSFHSHKHPLLYATNSYSNYPIYQQSFPGENRPTTPDYGYGPRKDNFNPSGSHTQPSVGAHRDKSGFQPYQHKHNSHDQHFHQDNRPVQPPRFYPSDTQNTPERPEMKNGSDDSDAGSAGTQWKRRLLPTDECGASLGERIVGGKNAALGAYPWMARIGYTRE
jgi:hypothetical protein